MAILPVAKFKQDSFTASRFGATPSMRRLDFAFNVYSAAYVNASVNTVQMVIAGALSNWNLINGTAGVRVSQLAGLGFFRVTFSANVYATFSNDQAGRSMADDLARSGFIVSALSVSGSTGITGSNIFPSTSTAGGSTYTVQAGDTLSKIAARFGTTWQTLAALNSLSNPNVLQIGQVLRVTGSAQTPPTKPITGTPTPQTPTPNATPTPAPTGSGIESFAAKLGLTASAFIILAVVGGMVIINKK